MPPNYRTSRSPLDNALFIAPGKGWLIFPGIKKRATDGSPVRKKWTSRDGAVSVAIDDEDLIDVAEIIGGLFEADDLHEEIGITRSEG